MSSNSSNHDRYRFRWSLLSPGNGLTWVGLVCFFVVTLLPMSLTDRIGSFIGRSVARRNRRRFNIVETNLSLCFPEKKISEIREMVLDHFQVQIRSVVHYFILWWRPASVVRKKIKMSGFEKVGQYQEQG
ncbi:MAG TPA: hypothetical protein ENJ87_08080, partial [Gammaproteobacteria bacterium]|nr:hypothetical protein [Gammaproteobacteria bacterium]